MMVFRKSTGRPIKEAGDSTNFPRVLGRKNHPPQRNFGRSKNIATMGSVIGGVFGKTVMAQRSFPKNQYVRYPQAERVPPSRNMSIYVDDRSNQQMAQLAGQITKHPIIPLLDRPKPLIKMMKERAPIVPRTKLLGSFGLVGQRERGSKIHGRYFGKEGVNIPRPMSGRQTFSNVGTRRIDTMPSVIADNLPSGGGGPRRSMHPSRARRLSVQV